MIHNFSFRSRKKKKWKYSYNLSIQNTNSIPCQKLKTRYKECPKKNPVSTCFSCYRIVTGKRKRDEFNSFSPYSLLPFSWEATKLRMTSIAN
ncbi:hypothetical protein RHGRI_038076 [Rhododendron griersonianum]|uniref:Uncharacterized protein n=1 Tax=Rhododendron griersonianum TaxID=479676 RepID=A0AAV6I046_9ERIC|nr:hypothetical protein RHGRI_038076 [Rhododendron griersonianum]